MKNSRYFGYFNSNKNTPAYDPRFTVPCLICDKAMMPGTVKTVSLMRPNDNKSYFYRVHKMCEEGLTEDERIMYDSSLIDNL